MSEQEQSLNELLNKFFVMPAAKDAPQVGSIRRAAFTPELRGIDEKNRTIDFVASTEAVDRYGDILRAHGFVTTNYMKNPVFLWAHKSQEPPIGRTLALSIETAPRPALIQRVQFATKEQYPFADTIFNLYKGKFLNAVSVGFIPLTPPEPIIDDATGRMTGYEFTSQELLELSAVPLPANPECVSRAIDSGIIGADDVAKIFVAPKEELADAKDYIRLAFKLGELSHSVERFKFAVREARGIASPEDLSRVLGIQAHGEIASVGDLERLFKLE
jgi:Caudovirus prohead serine protease